MDHSQFVTACLLACSLVSLVVMTERYVNPYGIGRNVGDVRLPGLPPMPTLLSPVPPPTPPPRRATASDGSGAARRTTSATSFGGPMGLTPPDTPRRSPSPRTHREREERREARARDQNQEFEYEVRHGVSFDDRVRDWTVRLGSVERIIRELSHAHIEQR